MFELIFYILIKPLLEGYALPIIPKMEHSATQETVVSMPVRIYDDVLDVVITAESAIAVDATTGAILFEKEASQKRSIASITKLMTVLVFLEGNPSLSGSIIMTAQDRSRGGIEHFFIGEEVRVSDVVYAALVGSDNDAAHMLARASGGVEAFVEKMNAKARALGMEDTVFVEPTGLHAGNTSTARDIVILLQEASKLQLLADASTRRSYTFEVTGLDDKPRTVKVYTTNQLASSPYLEVTVAKTGYVPEAGYCVATFLKGSNERPYYIVVLGSSDITARFQDAKTLEYFISHAYQYE